jgi:hypothetical protein
MTTVNKIADLSFPDMDALDMNIDRTVRIMTVSMSGAWIEGPVAAGDLVISEWESVRQRRFEYEKNMWFDIPCEDEEGFKDISEFECDDHQITMRGFGKESGAWLEMVVKGGKAEYQRRGGPVGRG